MRALNPAVKAKIEPDFALGARRKSIEPLGSLMMPSAHTVT